MNTLAIASDVPVTTEIKAQVETMIDKVMHSLPPAAELTSTQRREMIARYTAVLEGNFIYWMTAAYLAVKSEEARPIIVDNLNEEIRDSHPVMLRNFAIAAHAFPSEQDALAVNEELNSVRRFLGRMQAVPTLVAMAYFEGFIQRFMAYLAELAVAQGSRELEYTDVHGVCDIEHTEGLFRALTFEMELNPPPANTNLFEGAELLDTLLHAILFGKQQTLAA
jgi:hypothetical protein